MRSAYNKQTDRFDVAKLTLFNQLAASIRYIMFKLPGWQAT
jgi:hypothetical protein